MWQTRLWFSKETPYFKTLRITSVMCYNNSDIIHLPFFVMYNQKMCYHFVHKTFIKGKSARSFTLKDSLSCVLVAFIYLQLEPSLVTCSVHLITSCFSSVEVRWGPLKVLIWLCYSNSKKREFIYVRCICSIDEVTLLCFIFMHITTITDVIS